MQSNDQDVLDLVHMICDDIDNNNAFYSLLKYLAVGRGHFKTVNQECLLPFLSNETKIEIRSLILDAFEKQGYQPFTKSNLKDIIELLLTNRYKQDSDDEEIFRFGIIKWVDSMLKEPSNHKFNLGRAFNRLISTSTIDSVWVALSKIRQSSRSSLVFETLDTIWRLHYKNIGYTIGEKEISSFISISKHYQLFNDQNAYNQQQQQQQQLPLLLLLLQEITESIYTNMPPQSNLWRNKDFQVFFKQTIGVLFQSAYKEDTFIPQRFEKDYSRFMVDWNSQNYSEPNIAPKSRFGFLAFIKWDDQTLTTISEYLQVFFNNCSTSWKEKLIFLGILNQIKDIELVLLQPNSILLTIQI
ncbi:hypothetical protein DFA_10344 [Cavenderia fasciculata]|uniref:Uncharacterized protein n=1 Tax=Cavenderia fasciculata TaxID=261658 RepID=F4Q9Y5_CACFS|nr:uncharacterized protein DFA_10344 [Cavenderia fasciculata]EGG15504.1 hypothetical protein DFA_10344 [Cavenderia fasciculata]|eukprot:XP_004354246.1 hypothetical protein DFA_10344 [Cavenderia fasciculata]